MKVTYSVEGELSNCPGCGAPVRHLDYVQAQRFKRQGKLVVFISGCDTCGTIFVNPPPPPEHTEAYYAEDGTWIRKNEGWEEEKSWEPGLASEIGPDEAGLSSLTTLISHARQIFGELNGRTHLDFGTGRGHLMDKVTPYGLKSTGIDPATHSIVTRHPMIKDIPTVPTFDIISAIHVIEHSPNPLALLKSFREAIKSPGLLIIGTPTLNGLWEHKKKRYLMNEFSHLSGYTERSLTALLSKAGFQVVKFYPGTRPERFRCAAVPSEDVMTVEKPLAEAEKALRLYRSGDPLWRPDLPVRANAAAFNRKILRSRRFSSVRSFLRWARSYAPA